MLTCDHLVQMKKQMKRKEDKNRGTIKEKGREFYKLENTATRDVSNLLETEEDEQEPSLFS